MFKSKVNSKMTDENSTKRRAVIASQGRCHVLPSADGYLVIPSSMHAGLVCVKLSS